jgi:hypothetical protein
MRLDVGNGNSFELAALRYEYPDITEDRWDSNWLVVSGRVTRGEDTWRFVDPCVTTFELAELADWLDHLSWHDAPDFEFTEPSLVFSYSVRPAPRLRVRFAHECAPPWLKTHQDRIEGLTLEFPVSGRDAADLATSVRSILSDFPIRGGAA